VLHRRELLKGLGIGSLAAGFPGLMFAKTEADTRLVVFVLRGAMDGLAMLAPYGDGNYANYQIVKEAVDYYDSSIDYSQFDNDGDGRIDYFVVFWTGPSGPWASFWWGYQWSLYSGNLTRDGVRFYTFSWQWQSDRPTVVIHETGHALGLPDYYDYDGNVGPDGGVGGLDMMHANKGDHCAFSKFMLGWIEPTVVVTNLHDYPLRASAQYPDAAIIMPNVQDESKAFSEYFMVQNRHRILNDGNNSMPNNGMLIWHVDATPTSPGGRNFKYNNSYTDRKLLRLMEADGLEEIVRNGSGDAGDYYNNGDEFSPDSTPNSDAYSGAQTYVVVNDISANGIDMTADLMLLPEPGLVLALLGVGALICRRCPGSNGVME
jgi:M6 family metalloprotease-like protein